MSRKFRILIAKLGLDGHDRGAKVVSKTLRDAGFEVIYSGLRQTASQIVRTAIQEDVDAIGVSVLSGAHLQLFQDLISQLDTFPEASFLVFGGGVIPQQDISKLINLGVAKIFPSGTSPSEIPTWLNAQLQINEN
jgi:methylmalonyl-CoA mutase C-terminal domain/subunit